MCIRDRRCDVYTTCNDSVLMALRWNSIITQDVRGNSGILEILKEMWSEYWLPIKRKIAQFQLDSYVTYTAIVPVKQPVPNWGLNRQGGYRPTYSWPGRTGHEKQALLPSVAGNRRAWLAVSKCELVSGLKERPQQPETTAALKLSLIHI